MITREEEYFCSHVQSSNVCLNFNVSHIIKGSWSLPRHHF